MTAYRTPDAAFDQVPDFPWEPGYAEVADPDGGTLRVAYVDAGPADGPVALLLHGEPSWSFLYRHVIRVLTRSGIRCVAPDMVGFGRSDKPLRQADYSYARLVEWTRELVFDHLDLRQVTLVGQDWGGLIGLRLVAEQPKRFAGAVAANTGLPTGDVDMPEIWWRFRRAVESADTLDVGRLVAAGCVRPLADEVRAAYDAPFPEERAKAGPRALPGLVPTRPDDPASGANRAAWEALSTSDLPFLTAFGDSDPITGAMAPILRKLVPGTRGRSHPTIANAGHFLQEDAGEELGSVVADFIRGLTRSTHTPPPHATNGVPAQD
jgi:haloalkane dehalogenase